MIDKFNVWRIVPAHVRTFYNHAHPEAGISRAEAGFFFGAPLMGTAGLLIVEVRLPRGAIGELMAVASIFGALLFNLLVLLYDVTRRNTEADDRVALRNRLLAETHTNVSFAVLLTLAIVVVLAIAVVRSGSPGWLMSGAAMYLGFLFVLTLLMILKRVEALLSHEIRAS